MRVRREWAVMNPRCVAFCERMVWSFPTTGRERKTRDKTPVVQILFERFSYLRQEFPVVSLTSDIATPSREGFINR